MSRRLDKPSPGLSRNVNSYDDDGHILGGKSLIKSQLQLEVDVFYIRVISKWLTYEFKPI